jgi:hypothetical protein
VSFSECDVKGLKPLTPKEKNLAVTLVKEYISGATNKREGETALRMPVDESNFDLVEALAKMEDKSDKSGCPAEYDTMISNFRPSGKYIIIENSSIDDCAERCAKQSISRCAAFFLEPLTNRCSLSTKKLTTEDGETGNKIEGIKCNKRETETGLYFISKNKKIIVVFV